MSTGEWQGDNTESPLKSHPVDIVDNVGGVGRTSNLPSSRPILPEEVIHRGALARVWWRIPAQLQEQQLRQGLAWRCILREWQ
jgi:hypothetical protein